LPEFLLNAKRCRSHSAQQARNLMLVLGHQGRRVRVLLRDRDAKFCRGFDDVLRSEGAELLVTPVEKAA
jgi:hypothetical protein